MFPLTEGVGNRWLIGRAGRRASRWTAGAARVRVEWDPEAPLTPLGQASFFIEFLKASGVCEHGLPIILFNHKRDDVPVGTCIDAREDKRGLWIKGRWCAPSQ